MGSQRPKLVVLLWIVRGRVKFLFCGLSEAAGGVFCGLTVRWKSQPLGTKVLETISSLLSTSTAPRGSRLGMHHGEAAAQELKVSPIVCSGGGVNHSSISRPRSFPATTGAHDRETSVLAQQPPMVHTEAAVAWHRRDRQQARDHFQHLGPQGLAFPSHSQSTKT